VSESGNSYVSIPHASQYNIGSAGFTVAAWFKKATAPPGGTKTVVAKAGNGTLNETFWIYLSNGERVTFRTQSGGGSAVESRSSPQIVSDTKWHHAVGVFNNLQDKQYLYLDGALKDSDDQPGDLNSSIIPLTIGANLTGAGNTPNDLFGGFIDEVILYKEALTSYQIQQLYAQGLPRHQLANKYLSSIK